MLKYLLFTLVLLASAVCLYAGGDNDNDSPFQLPRDWALEESQWFQDGDDLTFVWKGELIFSGHMPDGDEYLKGKWRDAPSFNGAKGQFFEYVYDDQYGGTHTITTVQGSGESVEQAQGRHAKAIKLQFKSFPLGRPKTPPATGCSMLEFDLLRRAA